MSDWGPQSHYLKNALAIAILSRAAYPPEGWQNRWTPDQDPDWGSLGIATFELIEEPLTDTQGFVAWRDDCGVLVFRGTQPSRIKDWLTDLKFRMVDLFDASDPVGVHRGFQAALDSVRNKLINAMAFHKQRPIFVTGHSLGAALATLAARYLQLRGVPVHSLHTFGSPRVGDKRFVTDFPVPIVYRWVNEGDVVPLFPFDGLMFSDYHHVGQRHHMRDGEIHVDETLFQQTKARCAYLWAAKMGCYEDLFEAAINSHFPGQYVEHIQKILGSRREAA
jgi:lipase (class 3)